MVLMKKRGNKTKTKSSLVDYYAPVAKWEDEKKIIRQSTMLQGGILEWNLRDRVF